MYHVGVPRNSQPGLAAFRKTLDRGRGHLYNPTLPATWDATSTEMLSEAPPLPFVLSPPCTSRTRAGCMRTDTKKQAVANSMRWQAQLSPPLPHIPDSTLAHTCGPLSIHSSQSQTVRHALCQTSFWSSWLSNTSLSDNSSQHRDASRRCSMRLLSWRPRVCVLHDVYVVGAAQVMFNQSGYFGPHQRIISTAPPVVAHSSPHVEASLPHVVLTRNEYGAGYYHFLFDTLASISFIWPLVKSDVEARVLINACSLGREHTEGKLHASAPSLNSTRHCLVRSYATELIALLGLRMFSWPYTRQRVCPCPSLPQHV